MIAAERVEAIRDALQEARNQATELQDAYDDGAWIDGLNSDSIRELRSGTWTLEQLLPKQERP